MFVLAMVLFVLGRPSLPIILHVLNKLGCVGILFERCFVVSRVWQMGGVGSNEEFRCGLEGS